MKKFCESLRECEMKIVNFEKKKIKLLIKEKHESYETLKICFVCKEKFENKYLKDKSCHKVIDHCHYTGEYRGDAHSICNLKYSLPKNMLIIFHNGSTYDYHATIKEFQKNYLFMRKH